jgi:hypothetical protein
MLTSVLYSKGGAMKNSKWIVWVAIVLAVGMVSTGCSVHKRVKQSETASSELIGLSKKELLSCAGVPLRMQKIDGVEFLTYTTNRSGWGGRYCEVTFTLKNDIVEKISYAGNTGGRYTQGEQCAYVVAPCLRTTE